jgi:hypothetical protein
MSFYFIPSNYVKVPLRTNNEWTTAFTHPFSNPTHQRDKELTENAYRVSLMKSLITLHFSHRGASNSSEVARCLCIRLYISFSDFSTYTDQKSKRVDQIQYTREGQ